MVGMSVSAQTIWAMMLLVGCVLPCLHIARPGSTRLDARASLIAAGLVGLTCACVAAIYASAVS
jgi:hypothetical protein